MRSIDSAFGSALAGGAIGLLVGLAAGLSSAPVIAVLIGALSAGLLILLGLKKGDPPAGDQVGGNTAGHSVARIAAFGIVCAIALILGVAARAYDVLSPSAQKIEQSWKAAGYSDQQAREIALYQKVGLTVAKVAGNDSGFVANRQTAAGAQSSSLFDAPGDSVCRYFDRHNYGTTDDMLAAMKLHGGPVADFATSVNKLDPAQHDDIIDAAGKVLCAH